MEPINLKEILEATEGNLISENKNENNIFNNVSTDTRNIKENDFFVPLKGENFNGHNFIQTAFEKGASGTFIQKGEYQNELNSEKYFIEVENTLKAYQNIATFFRKKFNPFIVGITGSSGKTSTKELCYAFLKQFFNCYKTPENLNNEIGVPKTILEMNKEHKIGIIEMGMRGKGQIEELANIALPDIGIITCVGSAHIELLGSRENIALAKWELADYLLKNNKKVIIPAHDEELSKIAKNKLNILTINLEKDDNALLYMIKNYFENNKQYFEFFDNTTKKIHKVLLSVSGKHQISNALLVLALAKELNITYPDFIDLSFEKLFGRSEEIKIRNLNIINDCYNANLESMKASIETFIDMPSKNKKVIVLGEMRELGDFSLSSHEELGEFCSKFDFDELIVIGENAEGIKNKFTKKVTFFKENKQAGLYIKEKFNTEEIDILIKASRGAKLEEVIETLKFD
ncbi:MAG: UDP-N-acetylmuramoyl-tripeptide--D-alanyl-D-alanine ligase [Candidatus Sericytochromatia bacterium]